jgi:hypothetical protein
MAICGILLAIRISNKIWDFFSKGVLEGFDWPKVSTILPTKKINFLRHFNFESVFDNNKYSNQAILIGNLVTYNLVVISSENPNFEGHQCDFSDERSNLPKVI